MNEIAGALFNAQFDQQLIHVDGMILFVLLLYWVAVSFHELKDSYFGSWVGRLTFLAALAFGATYSVCLIRDLGSESMILASALGIGIALALMNINAAVGLACSLLFLRPWELVNDNDYLQLLPKFTFVICSTHALLALVSQKRRSPGWNGNATYVLLMGIWAYISTMKSADPGLAQTAYFDTFFKSILLCFIVLNTVWTPENLKILIGTLLITFFGVGAISTTQTLGYASASGERLRLMGIGAFSNPNDIAALMVLIFPFALMPLLRKGESKFSRWVAGMALVLVGPSIWLSQSRGAMLGLGVAVGTYIFLKVKNRWASFAFAVAALATVAAYSHFSTRSQEDLSESSISRQIFLKAGVSMAVHNPILGVGYNGYISNFEQYASSLRYEWGYRTAHNSWILVLAELGFPGFLLFVGAFLCACADAKFLFRSSPEYFVSLVGYGVAITFLSHSYLFHLYLLYGLIGAAARIARESTVRLPQEIGATFPIPHLTNR